MDARLFNDGQIEQFIEEGYVLVEDAFPREVAAACVAEVWEQLEEEPDDPATWKGPATRLERGFSGGPWDGVMTDRLRLAFDDLMGPGRHRPLDGFGGWPVSFPGFEPGPWREPETGWHVDGIQFHHHVHSPDQALLPIFIFTDIEPGDGGTCFAPGMHKVTARILADAEPEGLDVRELCQRVNRHPRPRVLEATAPAGSVLCLHPFMPHARSMNTGRRVRFICNSCPTLHEPMNLCREEEADSSPVERAIVRALGNRAGPA